MTKFRKKPVIIEAFQTDQILYIETLEGTMKADIGDWIITGVKGEKYPCKPDVFEMTYELIEQEPNDKLKACPFCGKVPEVIHEVHGYYHTLHCSKGCLAENVLSMCKDDIVVIAKRWNTRAYPRLKEAIEEIKKGIYDHEIRRDEYEESSLIWEFANLQISTLKIVLESIYEHIPEVKE